MEWRRILGLEPSADAGEIRRSFKSYISKNHPDKNPEANMEEVRAVISGYQVWILEDVPIPEPEEETVKFCGDVGDDVQVECTIDFFEFFRGCKKAIRVCTPKSNVRCPECSGTGGAENSKFIDCAHCFGDGHVISSSTRTTFNKDQCRKCLGRGKLPLIDCGGCDGTGRSKTDHTINVFISPGTLPNSQLRIRGKGGSGSPPGDLIIHVRMRAHPKFRIEGNDIISKVRLNLSDFLLGGTISVLYPDGIERDVVFDHPGAVVEIPEFGIPSHTGSRFIVKTELKIPNKIPTELEEVLRKTKWG